MTTDPRQVRDSLARQSFLRLLGAEATVVEPGHVVIELPFRDDLCQQNGFLHAGVLTSVADSACGYAALTLMPAGSDVLSVEFKVNLLAPGQRRACSGPTPGSSGPGARSRSARPRSGRHRRAARGRRGADAGDHDRPPAARRVTTPPHGTDGEGFTATGVREYVPEVARARPGLGTETLQQLTDLQRQVERAGRAAERAGAPAQPAARPARRDCAPPRRSCRWPSPPGSRSTPAAAATGSVTAGAT